MGVPILALLASCGMLPAANPQATAEALAHLWATQTVQAQPTPDVQATAEALAHLWATQTAQAQPTANPTSAKPTREATAKPTHTPTGTPTPTSTPTNTPTPTTTPTDTPTPTPTLSPTPSCAIAVDPVVAEAWDYASLGCPTADAALIWSAWEPFEHGYLFWRDDLDYIYAFSWEGGSDQNAGDWASGLEGWRWDGITNPPALTPPSGLFVPIRGFGFVWYYKLGGPSSQLGWGTEEEKGFCARLQPFEQGFVFTSWNATQCQDGSGRWQTPAPGLPTLLFSVYPDGTWARH